jgi:uncharacterized protein (DUF934 family)
MPKLIKDRTIVDDSWLLLEPTADGVQPEVPATGAVIVPLAVWQADKDALKARGNVGVWLRPDEEAEAVRTDLADLPLIAIQFPVFTDGRGFTTARLLRERYGYGGEIRAIGDVFRDQLFYMSRCGFNAFAVRADKNIEDALEGLNDSSEAYQVSVERPDPLFRRRLH